MHVCLTRVGHLPLALALSALAVRADKPAAPGVAVAVQPNLIVGDVITVTNTSGGTEPGSLRWALLHVTGQETIRFDPSLAGATITVDSTLNVAYYVTIEGPPDRGIVLSGGGVRRVMYIDQGAHLKNLTITGGYDPVFAAGIYSFGPLIVENTTLHDNKAGNAAGVYGEKVTLISSTVTDNTADALASGISWDMDAGLTLINTTIARNGPAPGIRGHGNTSGNGPVHLNNSIIVGNGTPLNNCWHPIETFVRVGTNISDDLTCGNERQMLIQGPERITPGTGSSPATAAWARN